MIKKEFLYTEKYGMHARPVGMLVNKVSNFSSNITVENNGKIANAKGIFSLMGLEIKEDDKISICIEGSDEKEVEPIINDFFEKNNLAIEIKSQV